MNLHNAEFIRSVTSVADCPKDGLVQIAFAGKSNVGKSSVINKLLLRKNFARVGQAPGKTTHINFFCIDKSSTSSTSRATATRRSPAQEKSDGGKLMEAYFRAEGTLDYGVMIVDARQQADGQRRDDGRLLPAIGKAVHRRGKQARQTQEE